MLVGAMMKIMIDPPVGHRYGFPKAAPAEAVIHYGGADYGLDKDFDFDGWLRAEGYPLDDVKQQLGGELLVRQWVEEGDSGC